MKPGNSIKHRIVSVRLFNARSLCNKLYELHASVQHDNHAIYAICETWCHDGITNAMLCPPDYSVVRKDRNTGVGGGVLFLIHRSVRYARVQLENRFSGLEVAVIDVLIPKPHRLMCCYSPPDHPMLGELFSCLSLYAAVNYPVTILGDLNFPQFDWSTLVCPNTADYIALQNFVLNNGFFQLVTEPTRERNILDIVLTNTVLSVPYVSIAEPFSNSDHCSVEVSLAGKCNQPADATVSFSFKRAD